MIAGLVFDVDDTLYWERDYVRSGFEHVGRRFGRSPDEARTIADWLWGAFEDGVRGDTFDRLLVAMPELASRVTTSDLVLDYRTHLPTIELLPGLAEWFDLLRRDGVYLGILTDGPTAAQSAKVTALGLDRWFRPIVVTGSLGPAYAKPGTAGFEVIASEWSLAGRQLSYVGDNPTKDFAGPLQLGWRTIRLRAPEQLRGDLEPTTAAHRPDHVVQTVAELIDLVGR